MSTNYTPPYIFAGLYDHENQAVIETAERERREKEERRQRLYVDMKRMHDSGIHMPGSCPFCPSNIYYD